MFPMDPVNFSLLVFFVGILGGTVIGVILERYGFAPRRERRKLLYGRGGVLGSISLLIFMVGCASAPTIPTDLKVGDVIVLTEEVEVYSNYRIGQNKRTCLASKGELVKTFGPTPSGNTYFKYMPGTDVDSWRDYCKNGEVILLGDDETARLPGYVVRRG